MRGISLVIATILILLMVVGAVGGVYVWLNRQQNTIQSAGEESLEEKIESTTSAQVVLGGVYSSSGKFAIIINNPSKKDASVTGFKLVLYNGTVLLNTSLSFNVPAGSSKALKTIYSTSNICPSGKEIKVQLIAQGLTTPQFTESCPA